MTEMIHSLSDMELLISRAGFMPFFDNEVPGFCIAAHTPPELWFSDEQDGPWEWKGPAIIDGGFAYGKFLKGKAMFVTMEWFPHFLNLRRSLCHPTADELRVLATVKGHHSLLTTELRTMLGYVKPRAPREANPLLRESDKITHAIIRPQISKRREGLETCLTHLQMSTLLVTADFEYKHDSRGQRYGWGVARYCTPEDFFGPALKPAGCTPNESFLVLHGHLRRLLPGATEGQIRKILLP